jgi:hypothetical protein
MKKVMVLIGAEVSSTQCGIYSMNFIYPFIMLRVLTYLAVFKLIIYYPL